MICAYAGNPTDGLQSFDNIGEAFLMIFVASTMEGWVDMMYAINDANGTLAWLYFVTLLLFITFVVLNLFVAVVCTEYGKIREENAGVIEDVVPYDPDSDVSRYRIERGGDGQWRRVRDNKTTAAILALATMPEFSWEYISRLVHRKCAAIMIDEDFDNLLSLFILLNTIFLAMRYTGNPQWYVDFLKMSEDVFNVIFTVEVFIKVVGKGSFLAYWKDNQNKFDFIIVMLSLPDLLRLPLPSFSLFRAIRLMRLFRLLKSNQNLLMLIDAVFASIPSMSNLMVMIGFAQLLFVLFGMQLFGHTVEGYEDGLRSNFDSFWQSNLTLFQCLSGENWTDVLYGYMVPFPLVSPLYFIMWTVFGNYVLLNLFIAVITENIEMDSSGLEEAQAIAYQEKLAENRLLNGIAILNEKMSSERQTEMCDRIIEITHSKVKDPNDRLVLPTLPGGYAATLTLTLTLTRPYLEVMPLSCPSSRWTYFLPS